MLRNTHPDLVFSFCNVISNYLLLLYSTKNRACWTYYYKSPHYILYYISLYNYLYIYIYKYYLLGISIATGIKYIRLRNTYTYIHDGH